MSGAFLPAYALYVCIQLSVLYDAAQKNYRLYGVFVVVRKYNRIKEGMIPMNKLQYTFKTDTLFKMLFVKHEDLLKKTP